MSTREISSTPTPTPSLPGPATGAAAATTSTPSSSTGTPSSTQPQQPPQPKKKMSIFGSLAFGAGLKKKTSTADASGSSVTMAAVAAAATSNAAIGEDSHYLATGYKTTATVSKSAHNISARTGFPATSGPDTKSTHDISQPISTIGLRGILVYMYAAIAYRHSRTFS